MRAFNQVWIAFVPLKEVVHLDIFLVYFNVYLGNTYFTTHIIRNQFKIHSLDQIIMW